MEPARRRALLFWISFAVLGALVGILVSLVSNDLNAVDGMLGGLFLGFGAGVIASNMTR